MMRKPWTLSRSPLYVTAILLLGGRKAISDAHVPLIKLAMVAAEVAVEVEGNAG